MPRTSNRRMYLSPIHCPAVVCLQTMRGVDMRPSRSLPPPERFRGVSPSQAAKSRPLPNCLPVPTVATMADVVIGPIPRCPAVHVYMHERGYRLNQGDPFLPSCRLRHLKAVTCNLLMQKKELFAKFSNHTYHDVWQIQIITIGHTLCELCGVTNPLREHDPNSANCASTILTVCACCQTTRSLVLCSARIACWSCVLILTNLIVGRVTASQMASASAASDLPRLTYGFT
jgi:hypothetical protein